MKNILEVQSINHKIGKNIILEDISFKVETNSIVGLFGPNGAGKSTLLRQIANHEQCNGEVIINGTVNDFTKYRRDVLLVTGDIEIPRFHSLADYCKLLTSSYKVNMDFVTEYSTKLNIDAHKRVSTLSKGNKEIAQLIAALATDAELILLDEPFSAIDIFKRDVILQMIIDCQLDGKTILITTHLINDIEEVIESLIYLDDSHIAFMKDVEEIQTENESISSYLKQYNQEVL